MAVDYVDLGSMANGGPSNLGEAHPRPLDATNLDQGVERPPGCVSWPLHGLVMWQGGGAIR
jgi:hypothetical protein